MAFVFPGHCCEWWSPASLGMAKHPPAHGRWWIDSWWCFACGHSFCFTSYLNPQVVSLFQFFPPSHRGLRWRRCRTDRLCGAPLPAGVEPQQPLNISLQAISQTDCTGRKQFNFPLAHGSLNSYELALGTALTDVSAGNTTDKIPWKGSPTELSWNFD